MPPFHSQGHQFTDRVARTFFLYHAQMCVISVNFVQITRILKFYLIAKLSKSRTSLHTAIFKSRAQGFRLRTNWRYLAHSGNSGQPVTSLLSFFFEIPSIKGYIYFVVIYISPKIVIKRQNSELCNAKMTNLTLSRL